MFECVFAEYDIAQAFDLFDMGCGVVDFVAVFVTKAFDFALYRNGIVALFCISVFGIGAIGYLFALAVVAPFDIEIASGCRRALHGDGQRRTIFGDCDDEFK